MLPGIDGLPPREALRQMVTAYFIPQAVRTMAILRLADHLADGPCSILELAAASHTDVPTLTRFLCLLTSLDLCASEEDGRVRLTPRGELLRADAPDSMRSFALSIPSPMFQRAWEELPQAVRTGESVFSLVHGAGFWDYLTAHAEEGARFDEAMSGMAVARAQALLSTRDLGSIGTLVDVGGGQGRLLTDALKAFPGLRGILFDRPEVLLRAKTVLALAGVSERCKLIGGDFFESVPAGGDAYVLAQILHDWPDNDVIAILRACHRAMMSGGRLWIVEQIIQTDSGFDRAKLMDIHMLVLFGARERNAKEYRALLGVAGFDEVTIYSSDSPWSVIEAVRD